MFRRSNRIIKLINEFVYQTCKVQERQMNIASHDYVLKALEYRVNRFKVKRKLHWVDDRTVAWDPDETGTIDTLQILSVEETCE